MCKKTAIDIIDPAGIIYSRAVSNNEGNLWITLNASDNSQILAGHFIADKLGFGIQHIAFLMNYIFKTAKILRHNGFKTLKITPNYCNDIEARFGLNEEFCQKLRDNHIFFDRDEKGDYFQFYSETYGEDFFLKL